VKSLTLTNRCGNRDSCSLLVPDDIGGWRVDAFLEFLAAGPEPAEEAGFLPEAPDNLRLELFRQLIVFPELTFNAPVALRQEGRLLGENDEIELSQEFNHVSIEPAEQAAAPDCDKISVARCNELAFAANRREVISSIDGMFDHAAYPIVMTDGRSFESFEQVVDDFENALDTTNKIRFLYRIAHLVHAAPFENFSKIIGGRQFRAGYEMWGNMAQDFGGVCGEKTAALKFVCDVLGIDNRPVFGSDSLIPPDFEASLRKYLQSPGEHDMPVHLQHHMLEVTIDGKPYLIDATNGNIPLSFLDQEDADRRVRYGQRARMVYVVDRLKLSRQSVWAGDAMLTYSQYHVPELHMQYVFQQGLGLHISRDLFIGVYFDWDGESSALRQNYYSARARRCRFPYPRFIHSENLHSVPDAALEDLLKRALESLQYQYGNVHYTGDFTFVIQPLAPNYWTRPRVSPSVRRLLWKQPGAAPEAAMR